jgi:sensor histidine kinase YesM
MKSYRIFAGTIISLFIGILASFPRIVRLDNPRLIIGGIAYTFVLSISYWVIHQFFLFHNPWSRQANARREWIAASILISILFSLGFHIIANPFISPGILVEAHTPSRKLAMLCFRAMLLSSFLMFILYHLNLLLASQKARVENERLKKENLQARLNSLKQQISPHFFFNTLNTLNSLTQEENVKHYVDQFSNVYRYLLAHKENDLVSLEDELKFIRSYLYILSERFEDALKLSIDISPALMKSHLPPLALQSLVENAIKHNIISSSKPLEIRLFTQGDDLVVSNNLQPRHSVEHSSGQGLTSLQERYRLLSGREITIDNHQGYFTVKLPVLP